MTAILKKWLFPVLAVLGLLAGVNYITHAAPPPPTAQPVAMPPAIPFTHYIGGAGITQPMSEIIAISPQSSGVITEIPVKAGNKVKKGQLLMVLDERQSKANLAEAEAKLAQAKAVESEARAQYALVQKLQDKKALSREEILNKLHAREKAEAATKQAQAALETAKTTLSLLKVIAPIEGTVLTVDARVGEYANANSATPLIRLGDISFLDIRVDIDENDAWRFQAGAEAMAYVRGNPAISTKLDFVRIEPYVRPKKSLTGDSSERVDTRVLQVIYRFAPQNLPIYSGQQMDVYIKTDNAEKP
ncbi:MAG: efflux RND transporter periplasmic adaptor subunit [Alphaproteobacteria bacterium]